MGFRYAHLADLHLGSWREEKMRDLSTKAFLRAIDECITAKVDFILFAGDLFNTSLPSLDVLKVVARKLHELSRAGIPLYAIAGSHDFSPSGKTMVDVFENAGLLRNVCKGKVDVETKELHLSFTIDDRSGAHITGILGRRGMLDKSYYENLHRDELEKEIVLADGRVAYKIFMFHTTISEMLPTSLSMIDSQGVTFFPKGFDYYAGGHIHHPTQKSFVDEGYKVVTYTGALFPANFSELEEFGRGGYYIVDVEVKQQGANGVEGQSIGVEGYTSRVQFVPLQIVPHIGVVLKCSGKSADVISYEVQQSLLRDVTGCVITIRLEGVLEHGKPSDIVWKDIFSQLYERGALFVMTHTSKLEAKQFDEIQLGERDPARIEEDVISEHMQQLSTFDYDTEFKLTHDLLSCLNTTVREGENKIDFLARIESDTSRLLSIAPFRQDL